MDRAVEAVAPEALLSGKGSLELKWPSFYAMGIPIQSIFSWFKPISRAGPEPLRAVLASPPSRHC